MSSLGNNSAVVITRSSKRKNPTGLLAKVLVPDTDITYIYEVASKSEFSYGIIRVINPTGGNVTFKLWCCSRTKPSPEVIDLLEPGVLLKNNETYVYEGMVFGYEEVLLIQSTAPGLVVRVEGFEDVVPI